MSRRRHHRSGAVVRRRPAVRPERGSGRAVLCTACAARAADPRIVGGEPRIVGGERSMPRIHAAAWQGRAALVWPRARRPHAGHAGRRCRPAALAAARSEHWLRGEHAVLAQAVREPALELQGLGPVLQARGQPVASLHRHDLRRAQCEPPRATKTIPVRRPVLQRHVRRRRWCTATRQIVRSPPRRGRLAAEPLLSGSGGGGGAGAGAGRLGAECGAGGRSPQTRAALKSVVRRSRRQRAPWKG